MCPIRLLKLRDAKIDGAWLQADTPSEPNPQSQDISPATPGRCASDRGRWADVEVKKERARQWSEGRGGQGADGRHRGQRSRTRIAKMGDPILGLSKQDVERIDLGWRFEIEASNLHQVVARKYLGILRRAALRALVERVGIEAICSGEVVGEMPVKGQERLHLPANIQQLRLSCVRVHFTVHFADSETLQI